jgi:hypothetical protein
MNMNKNSKILKRKISCSEFAVFCKMSYIAPQLRISLIERRSLIALKALNICYKPPAFPKVSNKNVSITKSIKENRTITASKQL